MSYLRAAKKATFQYHNPNLHTLTPPTPQKPLSLQKQCEMIYESLGKVTLEEFERNGVPLDEFNMLDVLSIFSVKIYNHNTSVDLFFETAKKPIRLKVSNEDFSDLYELSQTKSTIEVIQSPCKASEPCPTAIIVPGKLFLDD